MKTLPFVVCFLAISMSAQEAPKPIEVKASYASEALNQAAKDLASYQKFFDAAFQQAKSALDSNQKQLQDQLVAEQKQLDEELRKDKKYAARLAQIDELNKQIQSVGKDASDKFGKTAGPLQQQIATEKALIDGLTPVVRKENDLPSTAVFHPDTQTWTEPPASSPPPPADKK